MRLSHTNACLGVPTKTQIVGSLRGSLEKKSYWCSTPVPSYVVEGPAPTSSAVAGEVVCPAREQGAASGFRVWEVGQNIRKFLVVL